MGERILFYKNQVSFKLEQANKTRDWISKIVRKEGYLIKEVSVIFTNDKFLSDLNMRFLNHKTLTDIITFDLSEEKDELSGEIYISIERVKENAKKLGSNLRDELRRVIIHGFLHLVGYSDKTLAKKLQMRKKEDWCLSLWDVPRGT